MRILSNGPAAAASSSSTHEGSASKPKTKGLRTSVRAGDNPGMGPYSGDLVCITRQDGKTIIACYYE